MSRHAIPRPHLILVFLAVAGTALAAAPAPPVIPATDALEVPPSAAHAIAQLAARLADEAPEANEALAIWQWKDEALPERVRHPFRDDLEIALIQSPRFRYFHRERFRQILREHRLTLARLLEPEAMKTVAAAGIDSFLSIEVLDASAAHPEFEGLDTHTVLLAKLTDAATASIVWAATIEGVNPEGVRTLLEGTEVKSGTPRTRQLATAIAKSLAARLPDDAGIKTITLSTPPQDEGEEAGIGLRNPLGAPFPLEEFQRQLVVALAGVEDLAYVDPDHISRLIAQWRADSEAVAEENVKTLAQKFAIDGYLFGEIRAGGEDSTQLSMRLVSLRDGEEIWAGKFSAKDTHAHVELREMPEPPVPRPEPPEPVELTLEDIERPLQPPIPRPELLPPPPPPEGKKSFNLFTTLLYPLVGLPRDAVDGAFLVADRVPLAGAATTIAYRYSGLAFLTRLGTKDAFRDINTGDIFTHGQLRSRDRAPTFFPLVQSARAHPKGRSSLALQLSLGTVVLGDLFDATYLVADRTPLVGTLTTPLLYPLDYGWRALLEDRDLYLAQIRPGGSPCRLTLGSLATRHPWPLFPNARAWPFATVSRRARRKALAAFLEEDERVRTENERRLSQWRTAEQTRKQANKDALATLRKRNVEARKKYEQNLARVRRENQEAQSRTQREKEAVAKHNRRARTLNAFTTHVFDIERALNPPPVAKPKPPRPKPKPKAEPEPKARPRPPRPRPKAKPEPKAPPPPKAKEKAPEPPPPPKAKEKAPEPPPKAKEKAPEPPPAKEKAPEPPPPKAKEKAPQPIEGEDPEA